MYAIRWLSMITLGSSCRYPAVLRSTLYVVANISCLRELVVSQRLHTESVTCLTVVVPGDPPSDLHEQLTNSYLIWIINIGNKHKYVLTYLNACLE
jgi:hypothetical protein